MLNEPESLRIAMSLIIDAGRLRLFGSERVWAALSARSTIGPLGLKYRWCCLGIWVLRAALSLEGLLWYPRAHRWYLFLSWPPTVGIGAYTRFSSPGNLGNAAGESLPLGWLLPCG